MSQYESVFCSTKASDDCLMTVKEIVSIMRDNTSFGKLVWMNVKTVVFFSILLIPISFLTEGLVIAITLLPMIILAFALYFYETSKAYLETNLKRFDENLKCMTINKPIASIKQMLMSFYIMQLLNKAGFLGMIIGIVMLTRIDPVFITGIFN